MHSFVGVNFAKGLSLSTGIPLVPTHHLRSHIASNYISNQELKPPFLCLVVSGGHSHIVMVEDYTKMKILGKTRDDAAGEAFDKAARTMGMSYPGGIELDKVAESGNPLAFKLPRPVVHDAPYDFSFSGLKTAVINLIHNSAQKGVEISKPDVCASFRYAVVDCLTTNFKAAEDYNVNKLVIAGGVSAKSLCAEPCGTNVQSVAANFICLTNPLRGQCGNGRFAGLLRILSGNVAGTDLNALQQWHRIIKFDKQLLLFYN